MAQITINTPAAQDPLILQAFGAYLELTDSSGNPISATGPQAKQAIMDWMKGIVSSFQQIQNQKGFSPVIITPT